MPFRQSRQETNTFQMWTARGVWCVLAGKESFRGDSWDSNDGNMSFDVLFREVWNGEIEGEEKEGGGVNSNGVMWGKMRKNWKPWFSPGETVFKLTLRWRERPCFCSRIVLFPQAVI